MCLNLYLSGLIILTTIVSIIEIVLGGYLLLGYLIPFSIRYLIFTDPTKLLTCCLFIIIISINLLAIAILFLAIISGYFEKWISYEFFSLISILIIVFLMIFENETGIDLFDEIIVKEIYLEHMRSYKPNQNCHFRSNCFEAANFHRHKRCCGWDSAEDYLISKWNIDNENNHSLPKYCCSLWYSSFSFVNCTIDSKYKYINGCRTAMVFQYQTFNPTSYRYGIAYPIMKTVSAFLFFVGKKFPIIPRSEGIFSHTIPN